MLMELSIQVNNLIVTGITSYKHGRIEIFDTNFISDFGFRMFYEADNQKLMYKQVINLISPCYSM